MSDLAHELLFLQGRFHRCNIVEGDLLHHVRVVVDQRANAVDDTKATLAHLAEDEVLPDDAFRAGRQVELAHPLLAYLLPLCRLNDSRRVDTLAWLGAVLSTDSDAGGWLIQFAYLSSLRDQGGHAVADQRVGLGVINLDRGLLDDDCATFLQILRPPLRPRVVYRIGIDLQFDWVHTAI